jgi:hypothetical protein
MITDDGTCALREMPEINSPDKMIKLSASRNMEVKVTKKDFRAGLKKNLWDKFKVFEFG